MLLKKDATKYVEKRNLFGWCGNGKFFRNIESRNVLWSWTRIFRLDLKKPNKFFVVLRIHGKGKFAVLSGRYAHKFTKLPIEIGFVVESAFKGNLLYAFSAFKEQNRRAVEPFLENIFLRRNPELFCKKIGKISRT